jgi:hypothetical protein
VAFVVEVEQAFRAVQGLPSPIRTARGFRPLDTGQGVDVLLTAGIAFDDDQLTERGWFFDTDVAAQTLEICCARLSARPWTELFDFRPTFEMVARRLFQELSASFDQLAFVELRDVTFGTTTRYVSGRDGRAVSP